MDDNILDQKWSAGSLLRFAFPTIVMMIFMGLYTIVDTIFVAQFVNTDALSSINIVCPIINITVGLGTMIATGGNAIVSRKMGAGENQEAKEDFTLLILTGAVIGFLILLGGTIWIDKIVYALGASDLLFPYCKDYLMVLFLFIPANILQTLFSNLFVTAGKPGLGFGLSVLAGVANIILDYIFIVPCGLGIRGAALGTGFGYLIPTVAGLVYFARSKGTLSFTRPKLKWAVIGESCFNGSSEMVSQLATAVTTFLFNRTMMNLLGENGVAAITIIIYSQFLLNTLYIGYSMGIAPIIGIQSELWHATKDVLNIDDLGWYLVGNVVQHDYKLMDNEGQVLALAHRKWLSLHPRQCRQHLPNSQSMLGQKTSSGMWMGSAWTTP